MKKQSPKKLFAFIYATMMFSALPLLASAQRSKPCPRHYKQVCLYNDRGQPYYCWCVPTGGWSSHVYNAINQQSIATNFELENSSIVSIKIYDATGRLVKTIANSRMTQGEHQIDWDRKDENGNAVGSGIYLLKMQADNYVEMKKITALK